jgi:hypothetical protein
MGGTGMRGNEKVAQATANIPASQGVDLTLI